jgi:NAD(P)-dependent dehydrogenase (short-subunit alcohol dehydrogenase family)
MPATEERVAIVTGSGRGIGEAIAARLAERGITVVLAARNAAELEGVAAAIQARGGQAIPAPVDLADGDACQALVERVALRQGRIDVLVNNAGVPGPQTPIEGCRPAAWAATLAVNLTAPFLLCQAVIPHMRRRGAGRIVNVSSGAGVQPMVQSGPYGVAKAGLNMLTRILSAELAADGITVNAVMPGLVLTRMIRDNLDKVSQVAGMPAEEFIAMTMRQSNLSHIGRPTEASEVAATVAFLVSEEARAITGTIINHGGGWF